MPEPSRKFRVITVHGVNTRGEWQEEVASALKMFFDFEPIKYNSYRWFRGTELVLNPFVWILLGLALAVLVHAGVLRGTATIFVAILLIVFLSVLGTYPYRHAAIQSFRKKLSAKYVSGGAPPSMIAHSFGTYLTGRALRDMSWASFDRIVLAGCVLEKDFPWKTLQDNPPRFQEVRNEMAARDNVARMAAWLDRLIPGFGSAGYSGFVGSHWVHNLESANTICQSCQASPSRSLLHNVKSKELGHSDVFLGPAYAVIYWLPFLWGYDPAAYRKFLQLCFQMDRTPQQPLRKQYYQILRASPWGQCPSKTLDQEIQDAVPASHNPLTQDELDQIAAETVALILTGQRAFDETSDPNRDKLVQLLNVYVAIDTAWKKAFPTWKP